MTNTRITNGMRCTTAEPCYGSDCMACHIREVSANYLKDKPRREAAARLQGRGNEPIVPSVAPVAWTGK